MKTGVVVERIDQVLRREVERIRDGKLLLDGRQGAVEQAPLLCDLKLLNISRNDLLLFLFGDADV